MKRIRRIIRALDPKADATMGQREQLEAFRIRRAAVLVLVLFLLIASMTSCSVHALLVRMTPNTQTTAQATHSTSAKKPAKKTAKTNQHKTAKKTKPETKQSQEEQAVAKAVSAQSAALSDDEKTAILNKAQETAQNSGKPVTQYHYCIATKGNVGSADEFGNAAFRILNDEHGWPRAGAIFDQSTDGNCDFNLVLSQASEMTSFSPILADKPRLGDLALTQQRCGLGRRTLLHDLGHGVHAVGVGQRPQLVQAARHIVPALIQRQQHHGQLLGVGGFLGSGAKV